MAVSLMLVRYRAVAYLLGKPPQQARGPKPVAEMRTQGIELSERIG
jgi:hypothetical protein